MLRINIMVYIGRAPPDLLSYLIKQYCQCFGQCSLSRKAASCYTVVIATLVVTAYTCHMRLPVMSSARRVNVTMAHLRNT